MQFKCLINILFIIWYPHLSMGVEKMRIKVTVYSHDLTRARSLRNDVTTIDPHWPVE